MLNRGTCNDFLFFMREVNIISNRRILNISNVVSMFSIIILLVGCGGGGGSSIPKSEVTKPLDQYIWSKHPRVMRDIYYDNIGNILKYYSATYNVNNMLSRSDLYKGSGPDGQWFTNDDTLDSYMNIYHDSSGIETREISYFDPVQMANGLLQMITYIVIAIFLIIPIGLLC